MNVKGSPMEPRKKKIFGIASVLLLILAAFVLEFGRKHWEDVKAYGNKVLARLRPLSVTVVSPMAGEVDVSANKELFVFFSKALDPSTLNDSSIILKNETAQIPAQISYVPAEFCVKIKPDFPLEAGKSYTLTLKGGEGSNKIKDTAGRVFSNDTSWGFTTALPKSLSNPANGPGGPILVMSSGSNGFSRFPVEILRAEGWNAFNAVDISAVKQGELSKYDVIILGDMILKPEMVQVLTGWVNNGGTLIAFHPDHQLANLFGIVPLGKSIAEKFLKVNTSFGPGIGIVNATLKFHGEADLYSVSKGTSVIATLYSADSIPTAYPAVTGREVGELGGKAFAFSFDLAKSIVYTRQGNPAWAGQARDGVKPPIRSDNLFYGNASFDPQPEWLDMNKVAIPQADEQQRLLTNIIVNGNYDGKPIPRFWFLPKGKKAAVVLTGDDHGFGATAPRFKHYMSLSPTNKKNAVENWDEIRSTSYMFSGTPLTNAQIAYFQNQGFEISLHLDPQCTNWTPLTLKSYFDRQSAEFKEKFPVVNSFCSHRIHCLSWSDWASLPKTEFSQGIRLDVSYYYWPDVWIKDRPGMFTGSGMPMRFADVDGTLIDVYQVPTQMTDESGQSYPYTINSLLKKATGREGFYGVFCANMHNDWIPSKSADAIIESARTFNVPVVSSKQMLEWLDARNNSRFENISWSNNQLNFSVVKDVKARNLKGMLPKTNSIGSVIALTRNGSSVQSVDEKIKGVEYIFFDAENGNYIATYSDPNGTRDKRLVKETK